MTPSRWQRVKELFHSALALPPDERSPFLAEACQGQDSLRKEVESLIKAHEGAGSFIAAPAYEIAADLIADDYLELSQGQMIGPYEIISLLGKGGMGEVYLAEDRRLGRKVALKLLPVSLTIDIDRLRRFEREARAASALNHPNILTIYEIGRIGDKHFIATEYIEGETLRQRMMVAHPGFHEALEVAIQVAAALSTAHAAGIVHRDVKPENIMLRHDGYIKILDFGLAKLTEQPSASSPDAPTKPMLKTSPGTVMGTVSYMSPEQARGLEVDARTDIWSLGVVLYEMISGHAPFAGPTASDLIVSILEREPPPLSTSAPDVPIELQRIVKKALCKDREERYQTIKDLLVDLKGLKQDLDATTHTARGTRSPSSKSKSVTRVALILLASFLIAVAAFVLYRFIARNASTTTSEVKSGSHEATGVSKTMQITFSSGLDGYPAFSPDGRSITYSSDKSGNFEIYVKQLTPGGSEIQITSDGKQNSQPAWSPDGQRITYYSKRGGIWVVTALGGIPKQLTEFGGRPSWSPDGSFIAFQSVSGLDRDHTAFGALPPSTIWIVPSQGGTPRQLTQVANPPGGHGAPSWSPDGKRIVFDTYDLRVSGIWSAAISGAELRRVTRVTDDTFITYDPVYSPDGSHIYFAKVSGNSIFGLWRVRVSAETGELLGEPVEVANMGATRPRVLTISKDGKKIAYGAVSSSSNIWSLSVSPSSHEAIGGPAPLTRDTSLRNSTPAFSPDGQKIAFIVWRAGTKPDIWLMDADGKNPMPMTTDPASDFSPTWFPESDQIAFLSDRSGRSVLLSVMLSKMAERPILDVGQDFALARLSPDGKQVAFNSNKSGTINIWMAALEGGQARQLTFDRELMGFPCWSPDGQYIAFMMKRGEDSHAMIVPSSGGTPEQLTFDRGESWPYSWSPDGDKIAFAGYRNGYWNIWWVSRKDKRQKQVSNYTKLNAYIRYPAWSPLGDKIVYEYGETISDIWMIELR
jgi:Tol biopolymer transport system component/predicted Ser/Thr protein kinase